MRTTRRERARFQPQGACRNGRIYSHLPQPPRFIATAMHLAMMSSTQGDRELIADLATKSPGLGETQMMRVRRAATADKTRLLGDIANMLAIANTARFS